MPPHGGEEINPQQGPSRASPCTSALKQGILAMLGKLCKLADRHMQVAHRRGGLWDLGQQRKGGLRFANYQSETAQGADGGFGVKSP